MPLLLALFACGPTEPQVWLDPTTLTTDAGLFTLSVEGSPLPPASGEAFTLGIAVEGATNASIEVEPWMPEHGHGVHEAPVISAGETAGDFSAEWTFSMAGYWEVRVDVTADEGGDGATLAWDVE